jgi:hypothetical protein
MLPEVIYLKNVEPAKMIRGDAVYAKFITCVN